MRTMPAMLLSIAVMSTPGLGHAATPVPFRWIGLEAALEPGTEPADAVGRWLTERLHEESLLPRSDSMRSSRSRAFGDRTRVLLSQWTTGGAVEGTGCTVVVGGRGVVESAIGQTVPSHPIPPVPLGSQAGEQVLWLAGERAAWAVRRLVRDPSGTERFEWREIPSGALLASQPLFAHAPGRVFEHDPRGAVVEVPLMGLPSRASRLVGERVSVNEPDRPPLEVPDGDFRFDPSGPDSLSFDLVNAYWHVDHFLGEELRAMGGQPLSSPVVVRIRMPLEPNVAVTSGPYILLGRPIAGFSRESWRADDLMRHEATHALLFDFGIPGTGPDRESSALHEGIADYLAAAATSDPSIGEWVYRLYPQGVTRVDSDPAVFRYEQYDHVRWGGVATGSAWANGMILSGALWDLRALLGATADSLVMEAVIHLPPEPLWMDLALALLEADWRMHEGRHALAITRALAGRGILARSGVEISGPVRTELGDRAVFQAVRRPPDPDARWFWYVRAWCGTNPCSGGFVAVAGGPTLEWPVEGEFEVLAQSVSSSGQILSDQRFVPLSPPYAIDGPSSAALGDTLRYQARSRSGNPVPARWTRRGLETGAPAEELGVGGWVRLVAAAPFRLEARLDGTWTTDLLTIRAVDVVPVVDVVAPGTEDRLWARITPDGTLEGGIRLAREVAVPRLQLFDIGGRLVRDLHRGPMEAGDHPVHSDLGGIPPGVYLLGLRTERGTLVRRIVRLR